MKNQTFFLSLSGFLTHELDAVMQHEWRLLYVLRTWQDDVAAQCFIGVHVPLTFAIFALAFHSEPTTQRLARQFMAAFFVVHALLHWRLMGNVLAPFDNALSLALIHGVGLGGVMYLMLDFAKPSKPKS